MPNPNGQTSDRSIIHPSSPVPESPPILGLALFINSSLKFSGFHHWRRPVLIRQRSGESMPFHKTKNFMYLNEFRLGVSRSRIHVSVRHQHDTDTYDYIWTMWFSQIIIGAGVSMSIIVSCLYLCFIGP